MFIHFIVLYLYTMLNFLGFNDTSGLRVSRGVLRDSKKHLGNIFTKIIQVSPELKDQIERDFKECLLDAQTNETTYINFEKKYSFDDIKDLTHLLTNTIPLESKFLIDLIEERNKMAIVKNPDKEEIAEKNTVINKKITFINNIIKLLRDYSSEFINEKNIQEEKCKKLEENSEKNKDKITQKKEKLNIYNTFISACNDNLENFEKTLDNIREHNSKDPKENQSFTNIQTAQNPEKKEQPKRTKLQDFLKKQKYKPSATAASTDNQEHDQQEMDDYKAGMDQINKEKEQQDKLLDMIQASVLRIANQGKEIGHEIDAQIVKMKEVETKMDQHQDKIITLNKRIVKLLEETSKGEKITIAIGVFLVFCIIIFIFYKVNGVYGIFD
jgi:hypothetical protein